MPEGQSQNADSGVQLTPEERAVDLADAFFVANGLQVVSLHGQDPRDISAQWTLAIASAIRAAVAEERALWRVWCVACEEAERSSREAQLADAVAWSQAKEREACAKVAEGWPHSNSKSCRLHDDDPCCHVRTGAGIAAAIRARGIK